MEAKPSITLQTAKEQRGELRPATSQAITLTSRRTIFLRHREGTPLYFGASSP